MRAAIDQQPTGVRHESKPAQLHSPAQIQQCIEGLKFSYWLKQNDKTPLDLFGPGIPEAVWGAKIPSAI